MRKILFALTILGLFLLAGCIQETAPEQPIGGETDEQGCLSAAGYQWCESKEKCLRDWEEPCPPKEWQGEEAQAHAIDVAKRFVSNMEDFKNKQGKEITIKDMTQAKCHGCWMMDIEYTFGDPEDPTKVNKQNLQLVLNNYEISDVKEMERPAEVLMPKDCALKGGRVVSTANDQTCDPGEINIGQIKAFKTLHLCCLKE